MTKKIIKISDEEADYALLVAEEELIMQAQVMIQSRLNERNMTQKDLADELGRTESYVSQMLGLSPRNLTLRTIARVMAALDAKAFLALQQEVVDVQSARDHEIVVPKSPTNDSAQAFATKIAGCRLTNVWDEELSKAQKKSAKKRSNDDARAYASYEPSTQEMALAA